MGKASAAKKAAQATAKAENAVGKSKKPAAAAPDSPPVTRIQRLSVQDDTGTPQDPIPEGAPIQEHTQGTPASAWSWRNLFRFRRLPWWVLFLLAAFLLAKSQMLLDSPCAVLGISSPVTRSKVSRAYRSLTLCTHPDKLSAEAQVRGAVLFARATHARDDLMAQVNQARGRGTVYCKSNEIEQFIWSITSELLVMLSAMGWSEWGDVGNYLTKFGWDIVTFESGVLNTILFVAFFWGIIKYIFSFLAYLCQQGPFRVVASVGSSIIFALIPTALLLICSPFMRVWGFFDEHFARRRIECTEPLEGITGEYSFVNQVIPVAEPDPEEGLTGLFTNALQNITRRPNILNLRVLHSIRRGYMYERVQRILHLNVANHQFDFLITLTKPVIPLVMLLATGQVFSGAVVHMGIGWSLRNMAPAIGHESLHVFTFAIGVFHSLLGASAAQIEHSADSNSPLVLAWSGSFHDVVAVANIAFLGATVASLPNLGNSPMFSASFGAGIATRIILAEAVTGTGLESWFSDFMMAQFNVMLHNSQEVTARAVEGVGDCAGGPLRMLFGELPAATLLTLAVKLLLMVIPVLCCLQWASKCYSEIKYYSVHDPLLAGDAQNPSLKSMPRMMLSGWLCMANLAQCYLLWVYRLEAPNGPLGNLWVLVLLGCLFESSLSLYDLTANNTLRQGFFLLLFLGLP